MTCISKIKQLMIAGVVLCAALVSSCQGSKSVKSFSELDSLSYAIGMDLALNMGVRPLEDSALNVNVLTAGFRDAWNGKAQITTDDATAFIREYFQIRKPAKAKAEGIAWLEEVKRSNPAVQTTASGLMYEILNPGDDAVKARGDGDRVVIEYVGTLRNGNEFDRRDSITISLDRGVIPAWIEGLKLVGKGGEIVLWVPSELGYGDQSHGSIPGNSALKFEIRLIDVIHAQ
jgi:FKBP-type peptidyl-prolyl cis-trans isomerase